ncbi:MAG: aminotransferase class V-fold PLP-dependent enzyme [Armatimonadota bacterium]|nr:aminotransferase class V-fold PLP-dependent enzyme [Armatimonadota bacterium]MCX7776868.1 aminotransferase class V-fold PLP-dependent enzyme [Armatimonadota bacterium]MDW8024446.1 aminotransferase class V-fold PLP-dependent enzyme [Armatimonadota bacterium]
MKRRLIYLNNAATSFPKPKAVYSAVLNCMRNLGVSVGRGTDSLTTAAERLAYETRVLIASLFGIKNPLRIAFTYNATHALNIALKGLLSGGEHVITTSMEHNAVWRPLKHLERTRGVELTAIWCDGEGKLNPKEVERHIRRNTKLIVMTHASNVTGTIMPVHEVGEIAKRHEILFLVDAAQSAGSLPINVNEMNIDMLAFTGHKGLLGPQGIGGLYVREGVDIEPLIHGGTGSHSYLEEQPYEMPERLEAGTLNMPAIAGLKAALESLMRCGVENARQHEIALTELMLQELSGIKGMRIYGPKRASERVGIVSFTVDGFDCGELATSLEKRFGIIVRWGLHCAPMAHRTVGTFETGTIRASVSLLNTDEDVIALARALRKICNA